MNKFEHAQFLADKDKHSREHQQLIRDSKVGTLDLSKYKTDNPKMITFENEELKQDAIDALSWNQLRELLNKT